MRSERMSGVTSLPLQGYRSTDLGFRKCRSPTKKVPRVAEPDIARHWRGHRFRHLYHHRHGHCRTEISSLFHLERTTSRIFDSPFGFIWTRSEEHTSELQSHHDLVCRLLLEKK